MHRVTCYVCGHSKPESNFSRLHRRDRICRKCLREYKRKWVSLNRDKCSVYGKRSYMKNRERQLEAKRIYRSTLQRKYRSKYKKKTSEWSRRHHLKKKYGISLDDYEEMFLRQRGLCAVCEKPQSKKRRGRVIVKRLSVDHCHVTGIVRGLLCDKCNVGIGLLGDSSQALRKALNYLEK